MNLKVCKDIDKYSKQWLTAEARGNDFPISFSEAWVFAGYGRKDHGLRRFHEIRRKLQRGYDYVDNGEKPDGKSIEPIYLSTHGFKAYLSFARTHQSTYSYRTLCEVENELQQIGDRRNNTAIQRVKEQHKKELIKIQKVVKKLNEFLVKVIESPD